MSVHLCMISLFSLGELDIAIMLANYKIMLWIAISSHLDKFDIAQLIEAFTDQFHN